MVDGGASLGLEKAPNARDLGGYRTRSGRRVRPGRALRAEALNQLTDDDLGILEGLGLRSVVDFRGPGETAYSGFDRVPAGVESLELPVFAADHDIYVTLAPLFTTDDHDLQRRVLGDGGAEKIMTEMYRWFVNDPLPRDAFATTFRLLSEGEPVMFHCTAGKDRTGWMAAIVLTALDVPVETVYNDYLLTNLRQAPLIDMFRGPDSKIDVALVEPLLDVRQGYLDAAFDEVGRRFGSFETFVKDGLGGDITALRGALLE
ncbi:tyrosine-protein phosphatase [Actinocorallia longicatena]|uniref:Tyrosine specific protein phosphatases domain-containing protein n=1 Tax=Actinocorallia longicatena TaxID=111803 RepID=A0ABP6PXJ6_9ACTN